MEDVKKWATREDWSRFRPRITRLYVDEDRTLKDVMAVMESEHDFRATRRMYQRNLSDWGLFKHRKRDEMIFILHKTAQRQAMGKATTFSIRGRVVDPADISKFMGRRKVTLDPTDPPTPSHIEFRTPSPELKAESQSTPDFGESDNTGASRRASVSRGTSFFGSPISEISTPNSTALSWGQQNTDDTVVRTQQLADGYSLSCVSATDALRTFSHCPEMYRQPLPPQYLLLSEDIFFNLESYFKRSLGENETWTDTYWTRPVPMTAFTVYCRTASKMIQTKSYVDARKHLSNAFALVRGILESGDLGYFEMVVQGFLHLKINGHNDIIRILQNYITQMAATITGRDKIERPWIKVYYLIGTVDIEHLEAILLQSWKYAIDGFDRKIGRCHPKNTNSYTEYINFASETPETELSALHALLSQSQQMNGVDNVLSDWSIRSRINDCLVAQGRYEEANANSLEFLRLAEKACTLKPWTHDPKRSALTSLARIQYALKNNAEAEDYMREVIAMYQRTWGINPTLVNLIVELENWLREWGREADADVVRAEINVLVSDDDEVDEEMANF